MAKNITYGYFDRKRPDHVIKTFADCDVPINRVPISRLSWLRFEIPITWEEIANTVARSSLPGAVFFVDSSFLDRHEIPSPVWKALLSRKLVFTNGVWGELEAWRNQPFANRDFRALVVSAKDHGHPSIEFFSDAGWKLEYRESASYYISLLACRKTIGHELGRQFAAEHGREPTPDELTTLLQRAVKDRGLFLATKGLKDHEKPNFLVDEELAVLAIFNALITGCETSILTRDKDVLEQFYKAVYLLDTHYRSMLFADAYAACPENLVEYPSSSGIESSAMFEPPTKALHLPRRFKDWVLPEHWRPVNIYCKRLGGQGDQMKVTHLEFNAECEMRSLLEIKGATKGRNTKVLGEQNCHILISPPFSEPFGGHAVVTNDKMVTLNTFTGPLLDLNYSVMEIERFAQHAVADDATFSPASLGLKLASFRVERRLAYSTPPEWKQLSKTDLKTAIDFFDPAAIFFADLSFLRANHDSALEKALAGKGVATTTHIREALRREPPPSALARLAIERNDVVGLYDASDSNFHSGGYGYYLGLLAYRKQFAKVIASDLAVDLGREPTEDECLRRVEEISGLPGRHLAGEGLQRADDPTLFFNEELLVIGLLTAVDSGTDVVFLTRDPSMQEQFIQLCDSVCSDYASYSFARSQRESIEEQIPRLGLANAEGQMKWLYESNVICCNVADDWQEWCFPKQPYFINLHCWLLGEMDEAGCRISAISYCLERPMHGLLTMKGESGGRNLSDPTGVNLRFSCAHPDGKGAQAFLGRDRIVTLGSRNLPRDTRLDIRVEGLPAADLMKAVQTRRSFTAPS